MKVLGICGSPRKGNTEQMLQWVLDSCTSGGARTELILLRDMAIQHCTGCDVCFGTGRPCTIHDDMEGLIAKMLESDAIIIATPNYFTNVSGLMKDFIDRNNPLCDPPLLKDKVAAFVCVGGQPPDNWRTFLEKIFSNYVEGMKMVSVGSVIARAEDPGEIRKQEDIKLACTDLGNLILDKIKG
jgi:multimeric flavodoxin WrbA